MTESKPSRLSLALHPKPALADIKRAADVIGAGHDFLDRTPRRPPGRKKGLRTFQLHPKVLPAVGEPFVAEAERLGITQGELLERMWAAYSARQGD